MRILQISSAQFMGGGERYLADLSNGLIGKGHDLWAAVRPGSPLIQQLSKLPRTNITTLPLRNSFDAHSARSLSSLVKQHDIQIIHAHMARDYPLAAYAAVRNRNSRLVITRHVLFPLSRLHKLTLARVARVIAVSEAVGIQLRSEQIVSDDKIAVVPNGVDVDRFDRARATFSRPRFLAAANLPEQAFLIGTVGELKPLKGQEEFLRAAELIAREHSNAYFIVAGMDSSQNQENRRALEQLSSELGLRDRVRFIEWMDDIASLYCALDVFVSASRAESFGLAMVEAMTTHTAVVATQTEGAKEIIDSGRTGLLVPIGDSKAIANAVLELIRSRNLSEQLATNAAEKARERFSLSRMVEETEKIYMETLDPLLMGSRGVSPALLP